MIRLTKIGLWGMFINWYPFNIMFGHFIPGGTYIFFALIVIGLLGSGEITKDKTIKSWTIYAILSLGMSIFAINTNYAINSLLDFGIKIVVTYAIAHICIKENSISFAVNLLAGIALMSAGTAYLQMGSINKRLDLESDANISINDVGALMMYGCFAVIPLFKYSRIKSVFLKRSLIVAASILLLVEMFTTGSRKSLYAVIVMYILLIFSILKKKNKKIYLSSVIGVLVISVIIYYVYSNYLAEHMMQTSMYSRIFGDKAEPALESDNVRMQLYYIAWNHFKENPLWGIGFDNYKYVHGMYSHSTYVEPLACTGIISVFYLVPIFKLLYKQFKYARYKIQDKFYDAFNTELLIFYIAFLLIAAGIPYQYKEIPCIGFGLIIGWQQIYERQLYNSGTQRWKNNYEYFK